MFTILISKNCLSKPIVVAHVVIIYAGHRYT